MNEIKSEELVIRAGEKAIYGRIYLPQAAQRCPAVICSHGYNGTHSGYDFECRALAQSGCIAYAFDFCGGSTRSRSTGKSTEMTLFTEKQDLLDVIDHIAALPEVNSDEIFLMGGSQGGLITALAAEERAAQIRGMILHYPAYNIPDDWRGRFADEASIPDTMVFWELTLGKCFFTSMRTFVTYDHVGGFKGPVLMIHGEEDPVVTTQAVKRACQRYDHAELLLLPGEGHGFTQEGRQLALDSALQLIRRCCQAGAMAR